MIEWFFILTLVAALCSVGATLQGTSAGFATDKGFSLAILNIATLDSYNKHDPQVVNRVSTSLWRCRSS